MSRTKEWLMDQHDSLAAENANLRDLNAVLLAALESLVDVFGQNDFAALKVRNHAAAAIRRANGGAE